MSWGQNTRSGVLATSKQSRTPVYWKDIWNKPRPLHFRKVDGEGSGSLEYVLTLDGRVLCGRDTINTNSWDNFDKIEITDHDYVYNNGGRSKRRRTKRRTTRKRKTTRKK